MRSRLRVPGWLRRAAAAVASRVAARPPAVLPTPQGWNPSAPTPLPPMDAAAYPPGATALRMEAIQGAPPVLSAPEDVPLGPWGRTRLGFLPSAGAPASPSLPCGATFAPASGPSGVARCTRPERHAEPDHYDEASGVRWPA